MKLKIVSAAFSFALLISPALGQEQPARASVYIHSSADDSIGRDLAYKIRETVRRSAGMTLADRANDARFILRLVTLDPDSKNSPGISTVYSAVYTMQTFHDSPVEMYLTNVVGTCGRSRVDFCARSITAEIDEQAINLRRMLKNVLESQNHR